MGYSGSYVIVETMIQQNKVTLSDLEHLVDSLTRRGLITTKEEKALLDLARKRLSRALVNL